MTWIQIVQINRQDAPQPNPDLGNQFEDHVPSGGVLELPEIRPDTLDLLVGRHVVVDFLLQDVWK